jgi:tetratricopeptide (TPR) repeat protein
VKAGKEFRVTLKILDTENGQIEAVESLACENEDHFFAMVDQATDFVKTNLPKLDDRIDAGVDKAVAEITTNDPKALWYYTKAMEFYRALDDEKAIDLAKKAIEIDKEFAMAYSLLGITYGRKMEYALAGHYLEQALQYSNRISERERLYIEGDYYSLYSAFADKALSAYEKVAELYPYDDLMYGRVGFIYLLLEEFDKAAQYLEKRIKNFYPSFGSIYNLMFCYIALGELDEATNLLHDYQREIDDNEFIHSQLSYLSLLKGDLDTAYDEAEMAYSLNSSLPNTRRMLVFLTFYRGSLSDSLARIEELFNPRKEADKLDYHLLIAWAHAREGKSKTAIEHLQHILNMDIADPHDYLIAIARQYMLQGLANEALPYAQRAENNFTGERITYYGNFSKYLISQVILSRIYIELDQIEKAESIAQQMLELINSKSIRKFMRYYYQVMGNIALHQGKAAEAVDRFEHALEMIDLFQERCEFEYDLALAYARNSQDEKAEELFRIILDSPLYSLHMASTYNKSCYQLGVLLHDQGRLEQASVYLERCRPFFINVDEQNEFELDISRRLDSIRNALTVR